MRNSSLLVRRARSGLFSLFVVIGLPASGFGQNGKPIQQGAERVPPRIALDSVAATASGSTVSPASARAVAWAGSKPAAAGIVVRVLVQEATNGFVLFGDTASTDARGVAAFPNLGYIGSGRREITVQFSVGTIQSRRQRITIQGFPADSIEPIEGFGANGTLAKSYVKGVATDPLKIRARVRGFPAARQTVQVLADAAGLTTQYVADAVTDADGIAVLKHVSPGLGCAVSCPEQTLRFVTGIAVLSIRTTPNSGAPMAMSVTGATTTLSVRAGQPISSPLTAIIKQSGVPVKGAIVWLRTPDGTVLTDGETDSSGIARINGGNRVQLQVGDQTLRLGLADTSVDIKVHVIAGYADHAYTLQEPPSHIKADTAFATPPIIRVVDAAGNPVRATVQARLCWFSEPIREADVALRTDCQAAPSRIIPKYVAAADTLGNVTFDQMGISGPEGVYRIDYYAMVSATALQDTLLLRSQPFRYDPGAYDKSFVAISAIKTIAGTAPNNEFFDLRFRFKYGAYFSTMFNGDIAISSSTDTSKLVSPATKLTEALVLASIDACRLVELASPFVRFGSNQCTKPFDRNRPLRRPFVGVEAKIFNTVPYYGLQAGSVELGASPFQGSMFSMGLVRPVFFDTSAVSNGLIVPASYNIAVDFFVRSSQIDFFKLLNIRGSLLAAFGGRAPGGGPSSNAVTLCASSPTGSGASAGSSGATAIPPCVFRSGLAWRLTVAVPIVIFPY